MSDTVESPSVASASLQGVIDTLYSLGLDSRQLLSESGIQPAGKDTRVPLPDFKDLVYRVSRTEQGHLFGLRFAEHVHATTYDSFGVLLVASKNLRSFCKNSARYYAYANTGKRLQFDTGENEASLTYVIEETDYHDQDDRFINASGWAATWLKLIRMGSRPDYSPSRVTFVCEEPPEVTEFIAYFGCPIEFGAESDSLYFELDDEFDVQLPGGNAELARRSERLVFEEVRALGIMDMENAVRVTLFDLLPRGDTSIGSIAHNLGLEPGEVQAGLKAAGRNLTQVIGETRRELAEDYILRADLTINEVAYMLGFSDCSNFARSFRRWTGLSPSEYRRQFHRE